MPRFLDPTGHTNYGIGICDRCRMKRYLDELVQDPNFPGLRVCDPARVGDGCRDNYDPWRLPPRQTERINLPFNRPDVGVADGTGDYSVDKYGDLQPNTSTNKGV